jgi:hypothetical protein
MPLIVCLACYNNKHAKCCTFLVHRGATLASVVQGPVVRLLHIITALGGFAGFLKGEWLTLPVGLFHILSLFYRRRSPSSKLASTITVVGWMYRTLVSLLLVELQGKLQSYGCMGSDINLMNPCRWVCSGALVYLQ